MRKVLVDLLNNLPPGYYFDGEHLLILCDDCGIKFEREIRQRNIYDGEHYCKKCSGKHRKYSESALMAISKGAKKRSASGLCSVCREYSEKRTVSGMCSNCAGIHSQNLIAKNKSIGICSICGLKNEVRDQNGRGKNCECSQNWYLKHNNSESMLKISIENLKDAAIVNFIEINNISHYYNKSIGSYSLWSDFKQNFKILELKTLPKDFKIFSTFREQNSESWNGLKAAFEKNLCESGICWFVYIKFYLDKNENLKPLVVGKSGSLLVNYSGSDVSFSTHEDHGPARRFLQEENLEWCKTQIAIRNCNSEEEAYKIEREIQEKHKLFYS